MPAEFKKRVTTVQSVCSLFSSLPTENYDVSIKFFPNQSSNFHDVKPDDYAAAANGLAARFVHGIDLTVTSYAAPVWVAARPFPDQPTVPQSFFTPHAEGLKAAIESQVTSQLKKFLLKARFQKTIAEHAKSNLARNGVDSVTQMQARIKGLIESPQRILNRSGCWTPCRSYMEDLSSWPLGANCRLIPNLDLKEPVSDLKLGEFKWDSASRLVFATLLVKFLTVAGAGGNAVMGRFSQTVLPQYFQQLPTAAQIAEDMSGAYGFFWTRDSVPEMKRYPDVPAAGRPSAPSLGAYAQGQYDVGGVQVQGRELTRQNMLDFHFVDPKFVYDIIQLSQDQTVHQMRLFRNSKVTPQVYRINLDSRSLKFRLSGHADLCQAVIDQLRTNLEHLSTAEMEFNADLVVKPPKKDPPKEEEKKDAKDEPPKKPGKKDKKKAQGGQR